VQRDLDLDDATSVDLQRVAEWFKLLEKNPDPDEITNLATLLARGSGLMP
jgi:hypothetical protein